MRACEHLINLYAQRVASRSLMPRELDATNIAICLSEGGYVLVVHYGVPAAKTDINYELAESRTLGKLGYYRISSGSEMDRWNINLPAG